MEHIEQIRATFNIVSVERSTGEMYSIRDNKGYWVSQDGTKRYPNQFDYRHLTNTIKMIDRKAYDCYVNPEEFRIYLLLKEELRLRLIHNENLD